MTRIAARDIYDLYKSDFDYKNDLKKNCRGKELILRNLHTMKFQSHLKFSGSAEEGG